MEILDAKWKKARAISFSLFLIFFTSCAPLPDMKEVSGTPEITDKTPEIVGSHGELPSEKTEAILTRLKREAGPTQILKRNIALVEAISGNPLVAGNKTTLLIDGPATYASMLQAIRQARSHINWMIKNRLAHDKIHLSYDKSVLFPDSIALVDDSPINLSKGAEAAVLGTGLLFPWNEDSGFPLFKTLSEVLGYLDSKLG